MNRVKQEYSVSGGSLQREDLIPRFREELKRLAREDGDTRLVTAVLAVAGLLYEHEEEDDFYFSTPKAETDLDELIDCLNSFAGPDFYFGAHPNDRTDYGFWRE